MQIRSILTAAASAALFVGLGPMAPAAPVKPSMPRDGSGMSPAEIAAFQAALGVVSLDGTLTLTHKTLVSPTLVTPTLGVATATTVNGMTLPSTAGVVPAWQPTYTGLTAGASPLEAINTTGTDQVFHFVDADGYLITARERARSGSTIDRTTIIQPANYNSSTNDRVFVVLTASKVANDFQLEGKQYTRDFFKCLNTWGTGTPLTTRWGVSWYGDSVASHIATGLYRRWINNGFPIAGLGFPAAGSNLGGINTVTITGATYNPSGRFTGNSSGLAGCVDNLNGVVTGTITRSGTTATFVTNQPHQLPTGTTSLTLSGSTQSQYNGTFTVTEVDYRTFTFTVSGSPATPATGSPQFVDPLLLDFTYLPSAQHVTLGNGGTIVMDPGVSSGFTATETILATGPGMGSAFVELLNQSGTTLSSSTTSLSAGSLGATVVAFTGLSPSVYKIRITATGQVVHLQTVVDYPGGMLPVNFSIGGSTLAQNNFANATILQYLVTRLNIGLVCIQAKEEFPDVDIPATATALNAITGWSKIIFGSMPDSTDSAGTLAYENRIFRENALRNGMAYASGYDMFGSYAELVRLAWNGDGTHPAQAASDFAAFLLDGELGVSSAYGATDQRDLNNIASSRGVYTGKISVQYGDGTRRTADVLVPGSGADPTHPVLQNIRSLFFGLSGTDPQIGYRDAGSINILNSTGGAGALYLGELNQTDATKNANLTGNCIFSTVGNGPRIKEGTGGHMGVATFTNGVATVPITTLGAFTRFFPGMRTAYNASTAVGVAFKTSTSGSALTITSVKSDMTTETGDQSTMSYLIIEPAP